MNINDDKQLWDLLGKAGNTSPGPMFTQNVLRAIRQEETVRRDNRSLWLALFDIFAGNLPRKLATGMTAVAALFLCYGIFLSPVADNAGNYSMELASVEATVQALQGESEDSNTTLLEMASCYTDDMSEEEMDYLLANL